MTRRHLHFDCEGARLAGTLDTPPRDTTAPASGLLIVSGGTEPRCGAWGGQAQLAADIAAAGYPVFRFDRRGIGDSEGYDFGFRDSGTDIAAALTAFREAAPHLSRIVGYGNCDAASALMLSTGAGLDALVLANPWTIEDTDAPPAPAEVRAHYRRRLADPAALKRLLTGKVSPAALFRSLWHSAKPAPVTAGPTLAGEMREQMAAFAGPAVFLLADRDRTAQAFRAAWPANDERVRICPDATHGFVEPEARTCRREAILAMLSATPD